MSNGFCREEDRDRRKPTGSCKIPWCCYSHEPKTEFFSWWSWKKEIQHIMHTHCIYLPLSVSEYFAVYESGNKSQDFICCWYSLPIMLSILEFEERLQICYILHLHFRIYNLRILLSFCWILTALEKNQVYKIKVGVLKWWFYYLLAYQFTFLCTYALYIKKQR